MDVETLKEEAQSVAFWEYGQNDFMEVLVAAKIGNYSRCH